MLRLSSPHFLLGKANQGGTFILKQSKMKTSYIVIGVLAIALVVACVMLVRGDRTNNNAAVNAEIVIDNILTRTSVRSYQEKSVEKEKIETMLRAAMAAPTGVNAQPWHFYVVTDKALLQALAEANPNAGFVTNAPLAIVVCGDMDKAAKGGAHELWIHDCAAATENLLLAAHALGLGATWTSTFPTEDRMAAVKEALGLPDNFIPFNTIGIGYPQSEPQPKDKWDESNITYMKAGKAPVTAEKSEPVLKPMDIKEFRQNGFTFFQENPPILLAGDRESYNAMTIGWGAIGTLWGRPTMSVYVAQGRYTHDFMERKQYFTVMTFKDREIAKFMGSHSGRDTDKAKELGLHVAYTDHGTPYFTEADMVIECEIMYGEEFSKSAFRNDVPKKMYANFPAGLHSVYMGEVVSAMKK